MATALERKQDFINRMTEMGLMRATHYSLLTVKGETEEESRCKIQIIYPYSRENSEYFHLICHALMGLIAHFQNRKWAKGWSYTFIEKSVHHITFTNESDE